MRKSNEGDPSPYDIESANSVVSRMNQWLEVQTSMGVSPAAIAVVLAYALVENRFRQIVINDVVVPNDIAATQQKTIDWLVAECVDIVREAAEDIVDSI